MKELNFPVFPLKIKTEGAKTQIFDAFRKKWVNLSPEEWVRQHVLWYLRAHKAFPESLTAVETGIELNGLRRRCDIVYYKTANEPILIVECKAPEIKIGQEVFDQILRYNMVLDVPYLMVTNGLQHVLARFDKKTQGFHYLNEIPEFAEL